MTAHTLEAASRLDPLLLPPFQQDTYPDREFHSSLPHALLRLLLISEGLVGQDMRHLDKICLRNTQKMPDVAKVTPQAAKIALDRLRILLASRSCETSVIEEALIVMRL